MGRVSGGRSSKAKGSGYEREVAAYLNERLHNGEQVCRRALLSGGGRSDGGEDINGFTGFFPECKRTERFQIHATMEQAIDNARKAKSTDVPIAITRRNRQPLEDSFVVIRLKDFVDLVEKARERGA